MNETFNPSGVQMSREQGFLEAFFSSLSQFGYDKAKELAEKEKEAIKTQVGSIWNSMLTFLGQMALAEKSYMSLSFLAKGFLRKDTPLKSTYEQLRADLHKIEEVGKNSSGESIEKIVAHLCGQLEHFVSVRLELIDLYVKMYNMGCTRTGNCEELNVHISQIVQNSQKNFHHPYLTQLKTTFSYECDVLAQLLNAQHELQQWLFLPSLLHLHAAHIKLNSWGASSQLRESRRLSFSPAGFLKPVQLPHLYQWLVKFKGFLVSKFTLYFHEILSKQTTHQEMKNLCSKAPMDIYQKMVTFQRKSDALCVALVFDVRGCEGYKGHGYHHPDKVKELPKGLDSFPAVVCYPGERPSAHWPSIIMIMEDRALELNTLDRHVCFYDKQIQCTYLIVRVEPKMTLVIIFNGKKSEKDSYMGSFLEEFCSHLRLHKILITLRPGNK